MSRARVYVDLQKLKEKGEPRAGNLIYNGVSYALLDGEAYAEAGGEIQKYLIRPEIPRDWILGYSLQDARYIYPPRECGTYKHRSATAKVWTSGDGSPAISQRIKVTSKTSLKDAISLLDLIQEGKIHPSISDEKTVETRWERSKTISPITLISLVVNLFLLSHLPGVYYGIKSVNLKADFARRLNGKTLAVAGITFQKDGYTILAKEITGDNPVIPISKKGDETTRAFLAQNVRSTRRVTVTTVSEPEGDKTVLGTWLSLRPSR